MQAPPRSWPRSCSSCSPAGIWLQLASGKTDLEPLATSFAARGRRPGPPARAARSTRPTATWGSRSPAPPSSGPSRWAALFRRQPALGLVLGVSALTLAAVASADLLSGTGLAVTWAAESVLLSALAWRLRDARLQATALVYGVLAGVHVFVLDAPPDTDLLTTPSPGWQPSPSPPWRSPPSSPACWPPPRPFLARRPACCPGSRCVRTELTAHRDSLRDWLVFGGAAIGTYAAALALVAISFRPGHLAATIVAAAVGVGVTAVSSRRGSPELVGRVARVAGRGPRGGCGLRRAGVRRRGRAPLVRRLGADRCGGRVARRWLRIPAPLSGSR